MKALRTTLAAVILFIGAMTVNAQSMSIAAMRSNARFLTDRMAYTLGISDPYVIDEIYRINYDYIWGVNEYLDDVALGYYYDDYMAVVAARDIALRNLLGTRLWNRVITYTYFYRPIVFANRGWRFSIYDYDRYGVNRFYYHAPRTLVTYTGGHFFRPMAPRRDRMAPPPPARNMGPRGGAPAPNGVYRGAAPRPGRGNDMAPRTNGNFNNNNNVNRNVNTNVNINRNVNVNTNTNVTRPETRPNTNMNVTRPETHPNTTVNMNRSEVRTNVNANAGNSMRSGSNINSSSRFNGTTRTTTTSTPSMPTRSSVGTNMPTRSGAGASMGTRSSAGSSISRGGASMGSRGGGAAVGGRTGGGRR
ncbi:MAG: hypothetical protein J6Y38_03240 [Bacteroidaceae bacterium]|nr:hypothetical protein [Bacteroidaceae bacterium]